VGELRLPRSLDSIYKRPLRVVVATLDSLGAHDRASLSRPPVGATMKATPSGTSGFEMAASSLLREVRTSG
jgi:hypothetical protein